MSAGAPKKPAYGGKKLGRFPKYIVDEFNAARKECEALGLRVHGAEANGAGVFKTVAQVAAEYGVTGKSQTDFPELAPIPKQARRAVHRMENVLAMASRFLSDPSLFDSSTAERLKQVQRSAARTPKPQPPKKMTREQQADALAERIASWLSERGYMGNLFRGSGKAHRLAAMRHFEVSESTVNRAIKWGKEHGILSH